MTDLDLYKAMLRIRLVELAIAREYHKQEMQTPVHLCVGQEAIAVGVCSVLRDDDYMCSNHRSHGHYLAKGGDLNAMMAELFGKETGCSKGRGGSMHLVDVGHGNPGSSAIVGGGIPIAVGLALSSTMRGEDRVAVTFFGDGACDEGTLYESVRFAQSRKLPVLFVYENNGLAVNSPVRTRHHTPPSFPGVHFYKVDGVDVRAVYSVTKEAVKLARRGYGPTLLELPCDRWAQHVGPEITNEGRCPLKRMQEEMKMAAPAALEREIEVELEEAFKFARNAPFPKPEDVGSYVYKEGEAGERVTCNPTEYLKQEESGGSTSFL